jgi:flagellar hook protein FlgE
MGMQQGVSGLTVASKALDVISNNVANANTIGFKSAQARFATVFATTGSSKDPGLGVVLDGVKTSFSQGNMLSTGNPLDLAISGNGLFIVNDHGVQAFTRNGQVQVDKEGYLTTIDGSRFRGYGIDQGGSLDKSFLTDLKLKLDELRPATTDLAKIQINFNSKVDIKSTATFDPTNPDTYHNSTSLMVYDSLGESHTSTYYFTKTAVNKYDVIASIDGNVLGSVGELNFNSDGTLNEATSSIPLNISYANTNGADNPTTFRLSLASSTQFGSPFSVNILDQDGNSASRLVDFDVNSEGEIYGKYASGETFLIGQFALANFRNQQGLQPVGGNQWIETGTSGIPIVGTPGVSGNGTLSSGTVEDSNVDMTQELVNMMTMQRLYQANSQTLKTMDQVTQSLLNLR